MSCPIDNEITQAVPSTCLLFSIANACFAVQSWLGIPASLGLFSSPELPACQLVEVVLLLLAHGVLTIWPQCRPLLSLSQEKPTPNQTNNNTKALKGAAMVTGIIWFQMPYLRWMMQQTNLVNVAWVALLLGALLSMFRHRLDWFLSWQHGEDVSKIPRAQYNAGYWMCWILATIPIWGYYLALFTTEQDHGRPGGFGHKSNHSFAS